MSAGAEVIWVQCSDCGDTLSGNARVALRWTRCPACSSSRLTFAAPLNLPGYPVAATGALLSRWQADFKLENAPPAVAPTPVAPPAYPPAPTGSYPAPPPGVAGRGPDDTPLMNPVVAAPAPKRRTAQPVAAAPKASKTLVIVRLVVAFGAVLISGVVLVVFMLTRGGDHPPPVADAGPDPAPVQPVQRQSQVPARNGTGSTQVGRADAATRRAKALSSRYISRLPGWADAMRLGSTEYTSAHRALVGAHEDWRASGLRKSHDEKASATSALATAASARDAAEAKANEASSKLQALRAAQPPLERLVRAYEPLGKITTDYEAAKAGWKTSAKARADAEEVFRNLESKVYDAPDLTSQSRLAKEAEAAGEVYRAAVDSEASALEKFQTCRQQLADARMELDTAAQNIPEETPEGAQVKPAWSEYLKAASGIRSAEDKVDQNDARIADLLRQIAAGQQTVSDRQSHYRSAHDAYLKAKSELSAAEQKFRSEGGTQADRDRIQALSDREKALREVDKDARTALSDARKAVDTLRAELRLTERDSPKLQEALVAAIEQSKGARAAFERVLAPVRVRVEEQEQSRAEQIRALETELAEARATQAEKQEAARVASERLAVANGSIASFDAMKAVLETRDIEDLKEPLADALTKLAARLEVQQKLEFLTLTDAQTSLARLKPIEAALLSQMRIVNDVSFSERLGMDNQAWQEWRRIASKLAKSLSDMHEELEELNKTLAEPTGE